jgi:protein-disulfide isomerase
VIDVYKDFETADRYGVQSTPTFVILGRDGAVLSTLVGLKSKAVLQQELDKAAAL